MLLVFGSINIDHVFAVPHLPGHGDTVRADDGWTEPGGKGANQALAAARDGAHVAFVGAVGRDAVGQLALAGLRRAGIGVRRVARVQAPTGHAAVCVSPDGHTIVAVQDGANALVRAAQVPDSWLGRNTTLLVQLEANPAETARLVVRARNRGAYVIVNLSPKRFIDTDALRMANLIVCNSPELAWAGERLGTGNNPASLHAALGVDCVRMMGAQGADAMTSGGFLHMPVLPVKMRDTTAAGDCFVGVLAGALARRVQLPDALRRAAVAAALSATQVGVQRSLPRRPAIDAALVQAPLLGDQQDKVPD